MRIVGWVLFGYGIFGFIYSWATGIWGGLILAGFFIWGGWVLAHRKLRKMSKVNEVDHDANEKLAMQGLEKPSSVSDSAEQGFYINTGKGGSEMTTGKLTLEPRFIGDFLHSISYTFCYADDVKNKKAKDMEWQIEASICLGLILAKKQPELVDACIQYWDFTHEKTADEFLDWAFSAHQAYTRATEAIKKGLENGSIKKKSKKEGNAT